MGTVLYVGNIRIVIYPKDHHPPHVHAISPDGEAKFVLGSLDCVYAKGFSLRLIRKVQKYLKENQALLMEVWDENQKD